MLGELVMERVKETIGVEAWEAMRDEERERKYHTYRGDCYQHLRNIIVDAIAAKGDELLRTEVSDDLSLFGAFDRIEPDPAAR